MGVMGGQEAGEAIEVTESNFRREVSETFLRCKLDGFDQTNAVIELNSLKIAEDRTFADCARYILVTILGAPPRAWPTSVLLISYCSLLLLRSCLIL